MKLRDVAYSRSGDKGDTSNICVFPHEDADYDWLRSVLTADVVAKAFGDLVLGEVTRYEIPVNCGLNFVLTRALGGGVSQSLRVDPHGKSYQSLILDIDLPDREEDR